MNKSSTIERSSFSSATPIRDTEAEAFVEDTTREVLRALRYELAMSLDRAGLDLAEIIQRLPSHSPLKNIEIQAPATVHTASALKETGIPHHLLQAATRINARMPGYVVSLLSKALRRRRKQLSTSTVALLGHTPQEGDLASGRSIKDLLQKRSVVVRTFDPDSEPEEALHAALQDADAALIIQPNLVLAGLTPFHFMRSGVDIVIDATQSLRKEDFHKSGVHYVGLGRGTM